MNFYEIFIGGVGCLISNKPLDLLQIRITIWIRNF